MTGLRAEQGLTNKIHPPNNCRCKNKKANPAQDVISTPRNATTKTAFHQKNRICTHRMQLVYPACSTISLTNFPFLMKVLICSGTALSSKSSSGVGRLIFTLEHLLVKISVFVEFLDR